MGTLLSRSLWLLLSDPAVRPLPRQRPPLELTSLKVRHNKKAPERKKTTDTHTHTHTHTEWGCVTGRFRCFVGFVGLTSDLIGVSSAMRGSFITVALGSKETGIHMAAHVKIQIKSAFCEVESIDPLAIWPDRIHCCSAWSQAVKKRNRSIVNINFNGIDSYD